MVETYTTEGIAEYVLKLFSGFGTGVCVDIGAFDPFINSNSYVFERLGWDTYCIEPNPHCIPKLRKHRKNVLQYACGHRNKDNADLYIFSNDVVGEAGGTGLLDQRFNTGQDIYSNCSFSEVVKVNVRTLDWIMENEIKEDHIDYLSIDVEGNEISVLFGVDLDKWKPKVIVIESLDENEFQKAHLKNNGYRLVYRIIYNDIYVRNEYYNEHLYMEGVS